MSRVIAMEPVVSQVTTTKISNPEMVVRLTQALDAVCHQYTGTQTATPAQPAS